LKEFYDDSYTAEKITSEQKNQILENVLVLYHKEYLIQDLEKEDYSIPIKYLISNSNQIGIPN
jgi:hypothetical protein